jgi:hypothetical protein
MKFIKANKPVEITFDIRVTRSDVMIFSGKV